MIYVSTDQIIIVCFLQPMYVGIYRPNSGNQLKTFSSIFIFNILIYLKKNLNF